MTIQNADSYMEGIWDWGILNGCFGASRIEPTDIDGFVERKGRFLVLETKGIGKDIPKGQMIAFESLRNTGLFTIFIIWGDRNAPAEMQIFAANGISYTFPANIHELQRAVKLWYAKADEGKPFILK